MLIVLCGLAGSGKSTVIEMLERRGVGARVYVGGFVTAEVVRRGLPLTPACEKQVREELRVTEGMDVFARCALSTIEEILGAHRKAIVDAIYCIEEYNFYSKALSTEIFGIAIEASLDHRAERSTLRGHRPLTKTQIAERDQYELERLGLADVISRADHWLSNDSSLDDLENALEPLISRFLA